MLKTWIGWNRRSLNSWWTLDTSTAWTIRETGTNRPVICVDTVNQLLFVFRKISQCLHLSCHEPASYCLQNRICLIILTDCHKIYSPELPGSFSLVNYEIKPWVKVVYTTVWVVLDSTCVYIQYNFINENSTFYWKLGNTCICLQLNGIFFSDMFYCLVQKYTCTLIIFSNDCIIRLIYKNDILATDGWYILSLSILFYSRFQSGTMRTNCLDCLDRTNAVQSMLGLEVN